MVQHNIAGLRIAGVDSRVLRGSCSVLGVEGGKSGLDTGGNRGESTIRLLVHMLL